MTLTDTQRAVLDAALARPDRRLEPLPDGLKGGAARKVVEALIARGLAEPGPDGPMATDALDTPDEAGGAVAEPETVSAAEPGAHAAPAAAGPRTRPGTKQAALIALLRRPGGATLAEMTEATNWQAHTVRGALAGALKKRLGLDVRSESVEGRGRTYFLAD